MTSLDIKNVPKNLYQKFHEIFSVELVKNDSWKLDLHYLSIFLDLFSFFLNDKNIFFTDCSSEISKLKWV